MKSHLITRYVIHTSIGNVAGFNDEHQVVQIARTPGYTKYFVSENAARKFVDTYADCGYGLERKNCEIIAVRKIKDRHLTSR